jgi:hypothetical protein
MLWVIWLIFTISFLVLACFHWRASKKIIPPFQMSKRPYNLPSSGVQVTINVAGADIDKPLEDFVGDFNSYLNYYNKSFRRQNRIQALGYLLASLTAVVSIFLTI